MLELYKVAHTYTNGVLALDDVTLSVPKGMFGLLGPNGAGKSTLMRTIGALQAPNSGSIIFGDIDVLREPERLRATLGYLPQDFGVPRSVAGNRLEVAPKRRRGAWPMRAIRCHASPLGDAA